MIGCCCFRAPHHFFFHSNKRKADLCILDSDRNNHLSIFDNLEGAPNCQRNADPVRHFHSIQRKASLCVAHELLLRCHGLRRQLAFYEHPSTTPFSVLPIHLRVIKYAHASKLQAVVAMLPASSNSLHPLVENMRSILGTWRGHGVGNFPTLSASFQYSEELCFEAAHPTKPVIAYSHRTAHAETGAPMHRESGFMKLLPDGKFTWTVAQATGMAEVADGSWDSMTGSLCMTSTQIAGADKVTNVSRHYIVNQSALNYTISMATKQVSQLTVHLTAALVRAAT